MELVSLITSRLLHVGALSVRPTWLPQGSEPHPGPAGQYTVLYGTNLSLFKGVSDDTRAVAWDYLKFLLSKDSNTTFVQKTGYLPIRQSVFSSDTMNAYYCRFRRPFV